MESVCGRDWRICRKRHEEGVSFETRMEEQPVLDKRMMMENCGM